MPRFTFMLRNMFSIHPSITRPMAPPMVSAMNMRLSLQRICHHSQVLTNITAYMTTMAVRIIAPNRRYIFVSGDRCISCDCPISRPAPSESRLSLTEKPPFPEFGS